MPAEGHNPVADWLTDAYPPWDGLSPAHPRVAEAAYAYLQGCDLKAAVEVLLGKGPYHSNQISRLRHSRAFWREVVAQCRQRKLAALAKLALDGANQAASRAASAAGELETVLAKWLTRLEEAYAKRQAGAPASGPVVEEW